MSALAASTTVDVLVIGAGAAGGALCKRLSDRGAAVLCLEQGDWIDPQIRPKAHLDWEVRGRRYWNPSPNKRRWDVDFPVTNLGADPVDSYLYSAVGGSTVGFGAQYWRLLPSDFKTKTLDDFGVDWPIGYEDLEPYYTLNEREIGVSGLAGDPTGPPRVALPVPPIPIGRLGERWAEGFRRLGWYFWVQDLGMISEPYRGRPACTNRGFCAFGCPEGSLSTADVTYWPAAIAQGVQLVTRARVREILVGANGRATGAAYYDADGRTQQVAARVVVLCGGGIGTPRLLLMSTSHRFPDGLANGSGLVGRNLMVHVQSLVVGRFEDEIDAHQGAWGGSVASREFYETRPSNDYVRGFIVAGNRGFSPLNTALQIAPWGPRHHAELERHLNHEGTVYVCGDDEPAADNRVELDWSALDAFGLPGVRTHYKLSENSRRLGAAAIARGRELCEAAGAVSVRDSGLSPVFGWHLLGTARMGDDPASSVVDAEHRCHEVPNLYIADSSSFPTGGAVNPANTVQALALRAADCIWTRRAEW